MKIDALRDSVLTYLRRVLPDTNKTYALHEPEFSGNELEYVSDCIKSGWVSSVGEYVNRFERMLSEFTGANHAVALVNGTAALHVCLLVNGVKPGDEVLLPTLTFVATANAVSHCYAIPHLIDSGEEDLCVCPDKLALYLKEIATVKDRGCINKNTGRRISALCVTHILGHPARMDEIAAVCKEYQIKIVQDAAEALGSYYKGKHVGDDDHIAALSFNGNKVLTTGGGGAVLTNDSALAEQIRHLTTTGKQPHPWRFYHDRVAYNYRMPNLNAALGCAQLECITESLGQKRSLTQHYSQVFSGEKEMRILQEANYAKSNFWLNALRVNKMTHTQRDALLDSLCDQKIMVRPLWDLMHHLPMYEQSPRMDLKNAEILKNELLLLPSSPSVFRELA